MNRPESRQGGLTLIAILVLVALAVLGGSMGWVHLRSTDLAIEWLNKPTFAYRPMKRLLALGQRVAHNQLDTFCTLPSAPNFKLVIPQWGEVEATFAPRATDGAQPVTITGRQGDQIQLLSCSIYCPPYCAAGRTPEQCGINTDGSFNIDMTCP